MFFLLHLYSVQLQLHLTAIRNQSKFYKKNSTENKTKMNFLTICDGLLLSPQEFQAEIEGSFSTFISISDDGGF